MTVHFRKHHIMDEVLHAEPHKKWALTNSFSHTNRSVALPVVNKYLYGLPCKTTFVALKRKQREKTIKNDWTNGRQCNKLPTWFISTKTLLQGCICVKIFLFYFYVFFKQKKTICTHHRTILCHPQHPLPPSPFHSQPHIKHYCISLLFSSYYNIEFHSQTRAHRSNKHFWPTQ